MKLFLPAGVVALAVFWASASVDDHGSHAHGDAFSTGEPGDAMKPARIVQVTMTEAEGKMLSSRIEVCKDAQAKFVLRNSGELDHEFVMATTEENLKHAEFMKKNTDMEHDDPNARKLASKKTGEIVWKFSKAASSNMPA